ncbi:hypothetical protein RAS2_09240 [Phycisphaerae bacterium RAS2]|nr:hypothetical protein RAS2_09240 [Phycisphaerae bacterium RAS2]
MAAFNRSEMLCRRFGSGNLFPQLNPESVST